jgi:predicted RNA-binding Zn-ribbon protein involved in translation (DUF1610 family)
MKTAGNSKGTGLHRLAIRLFTLLLGVLIYWLLQFLVQDIRTIPGPDFAALEQQYLDQQQVARLADHDQELADLTRVIENQQQKQRVVGDSSRNLQETMAQLLELQRLSLQKNLALSETDQANFSNTLNLFLENQRRYQELSQLEAETLDRRQRLAEERENLQRELDRQREPAREEFQRQRDRHRFRLACLQLAILLPLLALAAILLVRRRASIYFPLILAFGCAALVKVALVMHEYFPTRYFKYVLIGAMLIAVGGLLVHFIRTIAFPKSAWLRKQYREAYERFLCPVCDYPIRSGPRRFLFWTRRTAHKVQIPAERGVQEELYTCPDCGTVLFEECPACHKVRHSLLAHCLHCGSQKPLA